MTSPILAGCLAAVLFHWLWRIVRAMFTPPFKPDGGEWIIIADIEPPMAMRLASAVRDATGATCVRLTRFRDCGWRLNVEHDLAAPASQPAPAQPEGSVKG